MDDELEFYTDPDAEDAIKLKHTKAEETFEEWYDQCPYCPHKGHEGRCMEMVSIGIALDSGRGQCSCIYNPENE